ncbi:hypothetical protein RI129_009940 [Pyrocoelia pectoralis]|uniref:Uncharacterized protein n=1 Tax=Pyrocoelia pectoralis TaxID=417401 RepID=A0AAN7ZJC7_9COLE
MNFREVLILVFGVCILSAFAKSTEEQAISTEAILKKELERFEAATKGFEQANINVKVIFTYPFTNDEGTLLKRDTVELRPNFFTSNPEGPQVPEKYGEDKYKSVFTLAKKLNLTAVASRQHFDEDGVLLEKTFLSDGIRMHYKDGNSHMVFDDDSTTSDDDDDDNAQDYVSMMKEFELPISVEITTYDESGAIVQTDKASYEPKKVTIISSDMTVTMQMKVAEALKRSCSMKSDPQKRILLLCRYLGIQFPEYSFNAVIGDGQHYVQSAVNLKLSFDGQVYLVWGTAKENEE